MWLMCKECSFKFKVGTTADRHVHFATQVDAKPECFICGSNEIIPMPEKKDVEPKQMAGTRFFPLSGDEDQQILSFALNKALSNRGKEWLVFSELTVNHIENYTVPQYGDAPNDNVESWSANDCHKQIEKYIKRVLGTNARGIEDNLLCMVKIAHYACVARAKMLKHPLVHVPSARNEGKSRVMEKLNRHVEHALNNIKPPCNGMTGHEFLVANLKAARYADAMDAEVKALGEQVHVVKAFCIPTEYTTDEGGECKPWKFGRVPRVFLGNATEFSRNGQVVISNVLVHSLFFDGEDEYNAGIPATRWDCINGWTPELEFTMPRLKAPVNEVDVEEAEDIIKIALSRWRNFEPTMHCTTCNCTNVPKLLHSDKTLKCPICNDIFVNATKDDYLFVKNWYSMPKKTE